jgi:hypothetical protein
LSGRLFHWNADVVPLSCRTQAKRQLAPLDAAGKFFLGSFEAAARSLAVEPVGRIARRRRAIGLAFPAHAGQAKSSHGLDAIEAFAKAEGFRLVERFTEHESDKGADALDRRPKLAAAIKAAKKAGGPVIVS